MNNVGRWGDIGQVKASRRFVDMTEEEWDVNYKLTLKTAILMSRAVAPYFIKQKSGKIITIGSGGGSNRMGRKVSAYANMKIAVMDFTKELAAELAGDNINVNCVSPGNVWGPHYEQRGISREDFEHMVTPLTPLKRSQTPEDIGRAVVFLVSEDARNITGQSLHVDGGRVMS